MTTELMTIREVRLHLQVIQMELVDATKSLAAVAQANATQVADTEAMIWDALVDATAYVEFAARELRRLYYALEEMEVVPANRTTPVLGGSGLQPS